MNKEWIGMNNWSIIHSKSYGVKHNLLTLTILAHIAIRTKTVVVTGVLFRWVTVSEVVARGIPTRISHWKIYTYDVYNQISHFSTHYLIQGVPSLYSIPEDKFVAMGFPFSWLSYYGCVVICWYCLFVCLPSGTISDSTPHGLSCFKLIPPTCHLLEQHGWDDSRLSQKGPPVHIHTRACFIRPLFLV